MHYACKYSILKLINPNFPNIEGHIIKRIKKSKTLICKVYIHITHFQKYTNVKTFKYITFDIVKTFDKLLVWIINYTYMNHNAAYQHERERYNSRREKNP